MSDDDGLLAHSTVVGGSSAQRVISCPASYKELLKIPDIVDEPSIWAAEGTALHAAAAYCVGENLPASAVAGQTIEGFEMTEERVATLAKAIAWVNALIDDDTEFFLETRVRFPGIPGAFGTADFLWRKGEEGGGDDYKFGAGVPVYIVYADPDEPEFDIVNPQLMFYMVAARHTFPDFFKGVKRYRLAIIQPRVHDRPQEVWVTNEELDFFEQLLLKKVEEAKNSPNPTMKRGPHCRWAACRTICKEWTAPLFDLNRLMELQQKESTLAALEASVAAEGGGEDATQQPPTPVLPNDYGMTLSHALMLAKKFEPWAKEIKRQSHVFLTAGGDIPHWKLVPKRAQRNWVSDDLAITKLSAAGLKPIDYYAPTELRSPKGIEDHVKANKLKFKMPDGIIVKKSSGTTIAIDTDPRIGAPDADAMAEFAQALRRLQYEQGQEEEEDETT